MPTPSNPGTPAPSGPTPDVGGSATGGRTVGSAPRLTWFDWFEAKVGAIRETTGEGPSTGPSTPLEHVRRCLGMDEAEKRGDARPTLVYFHWPHEHAVHGKTVQTLCGKVLDDEHSARWGLLFRCVQMDMAASEPRFVALLGNVDKPSFVVLARDGTVVTRIPAVVSPTKFHKALQAAHAKFPEESKRVAREVGEQAKRLSEARAALDADRRDEAMRLYDQVRLSNVRIGPSWERAVQEAYDLEQRVAREKEKEKDKEKK